MLSAACLKFRFVQSNTFLWSIHFDNNRNNTEKNQIINFISFAQNLNGSQSKKKQSLSRYGMCEMIHHDKNVLWQFKSPSNSIKLC